MTADINRLKNKTGLLMLGSLLFCLAGQNEAVATSGDQLQVRAESSTREVDYTLGSIATQHITLHVPPGFELDASSLPPPAQNEAIELREAHWEIKDTKQERLILLDIDWQIFVAGDTVKTMPLKKLHLEFKRGQQRLTVDVPADKVIVSSLLPARIDAEHVKLYPDAPLPTWSLSRQLWQLAGWAGAFSLGLAYMLWYFGVIQLPQEKRMPFRQAWRAMRALKEQQAHAPMQAMQLLSRAMDQFAGYAVTAENLPKLLSTHQAIQPYSEALQDFYQDLQHTFFAGKPAAWSLDKLKQLAKTLSQVEIS